MEKIMNERDINRAFRNPTAYVAIGRVVSAEVGRDDEVPTHVSNVTRSQDALAKLNVHFSGERRKKFRERNPVFVNLRDLIVEGNYDVFDRLIGRSDNR